MQKREYLPRTVPLQPHAHSIFKCYSSDCHIKKIYLSLNYPSLQCEKILCHITNFFVQLPIEKNAPNFNPFMLRLYFDFVTKLKDF